MNSRKTVVEFAPADYHRMISAPTKQGIEFGINFYDLILQLGPLAGEKAHNGYRTVSPSDKVAGKL